MATKNSGWSCVHTVTGLEYTNAYDKFRVECFWQNSGWNYNINNVSAWVNCNGQVVKVKNAGSVNAPSNSGKYSMGHADFTIYKNHSNQSVSFYATITSSSSYVSGTKSSGTSYKTVGPKPTYIISYNANGGSGAPGNQTKWMDENITLSGERPTRNGYSFQGWGTSSGDTTVDYNPGATYSGNSNLTLYAIWKANTYSVTYNANGGSGAPGAQTKTHDVNLTLSSTIPTLTNYNFKGWGASESSLAVLYSPGDIYSNNAGITLYAIWELAYTKPRIENVEIKRCGSSGMYDDISGNYLAVSFSWSTDKPVSNILLWYKKSSDTNWGTSIKLSASGTIGTFSKYVFGNGSISIEYSYDIHIRVQDSLDFTDEYYTIGGYSYPIDFLAGGKGVAFGKPAEKSNIVESAWDIIGNWHTEGDNRNVSTSPSDYKHNMRWRGIKTSSAISLNQGTDYAYLLGLKGWVDSTGGKAREIAFTDGGIFTRLASDDANWGSWKKLVEENDSGWIYLTTATPDASRGYVKYRLKNGIVYIVANSWSGGITIPGNGNGIVAGILPEGFRPNEEVATIGTRRDYTGYEIQAIVLPDGQVLVTNLYKNNSSHAYWGFSMSYPV